MRCQDAERLMLETTENEGAPEARLALETHLESCPDCAAFRDFRAKLRSASKEAPRPQLDPGLVENTRALCLSELARTSARRSAAVPWSIWAAFGILTVITLGFFIPQILDFFSSKEFTPALGLLLGILLQNAVMLFVAPVVMRRHRIDHNGWRECR